MNMNLEHFTKLYILCSVHIRIRIYELNNKKKKKLKRHMNGGEEHVPKVYIVKSLVGFTEQFQVDTSKSGIRINVRSYT